jgi:hypothetical protein
MVEIVVIFQVVVKPQVEAEALVELVVTQVVHLTQKVVALVEMVLHQKLMVVVQ